jgi:hypothetical protein
MPQVPVEQLSKQAPPDVELSREEKDRIAHLALALSQESNRRAGDLSPAVPYFELPEERKAVARQTIVRVIQALKMLDYIEGP